jgi:uncharacterized protein YkwD
MKYLIFIFILFFSFNDLPIGNDEMLLKINNLRNKGCKCGKNKMPPVGKLVWNDTLEFSAFRYARHLKKYDIFSHYSIEGKDVGERLDEYGYRWQYAGENLAEGQESFDEVLRDWIKSESHCKMLMNPHMKETGIAYFKGIWVQHLGKKI